MISKLIMKFKIILITVSLFTISLSVFAKPAADSVGVKNNDGKKMVLFKVKAKDTYYSIGRRYDVKPEVLMKFNGSKKATLSIGTIVNVPTDMPYKKSGKVKETSDKAVKETKKEKEKRLAREATEAKAEKESIQKGMLQKNEPDPEEQPATTNPAPVQRPCGAVQPARTTVVAQQVQQVQDTTVSCTNPV